MTCRKRSAPGNRKTKTRHGGKNIFDELYAAPEKLECFLDGMPGLSRINFEALADEFDFSRYQSLCDVGGATGLLCIEVAKKHPHIECITLDPARECLCSAYSHSATRSIIRPPILKNGATKPASIASKSSILPAHPALRSRTSR